MLASVRVNVCICVCMYVCMYECVQLRVCVNACIHYRVWLNERMHQFVLLLRVQCVQTVNQNKLTLDNFRARLSAFTTLCGTTIQEKMWEIIINCACQPKEKGGKYKEGREEKGKFE